MEASRMLVLSLDTGAVKNEEKYNAKEAATWGSPDWTYDFGSFPLVTMATDAISGMVDFHVLITFQSLGKERNYLRIQEDELSGDESSFDVATLEHMMRLVQIGDNLLKKPVKRVNLETGRQDPVQGEGTN